MQSDKKLFAFKLAEKRDEASTPQGKWKAREGLAVAGCTELPDGSQEWRDWYGPTGVGHDAGYYC